MNRSVINWTIAAGVLATGAAVGTGPAVADPVGPGPVSGADTADGHGAAQRPTRPKGRGAAGRPDDDPGRDWCCERTRVCRPGSVQRSRGDSTLVIPPYAPPVLRVPQVAAVGPALDPVLDQAASDFLAAPAAQAAPAGPPAAVAPIPVPVVVNRPAPYAPAPVTRPGPPPAATSRPAVVPPAAPAGFQTLPESPRLGYPEDLRYADIGKLASTALPGLAAIAGMTALGGLFGYRQARAGYVLRTASVGRFLQ